MTIGLKSCLWCAIAFLVLPLTVASQAPQDANQASGSPAKVSDIDVTPPFVIHSSDPLYPPEARAAGHQGTSILSLTVGTDGLPRNIAVLRRLDDALDQAAITAVSAWQYKPAMKDDKPVEVEIHARVRWRIYDDPYNKIAELWDRSDHNDPKADWALYKAYLAGNNVPQDDELAFNFLKMAADWYVPEALFQMGEHYYKEASPTDPVSAYMWYALAKRAGGTQSDEMLKTLTSQMSAEDLHQAELRVDYWPGDSPKDPK